MLPYVYSGLKCNLVNDNQENMHTTLRKCWGLDMNDLMKEACEPVEIWPKGQTLETPALVELTSGEGAD